MINKSEETEVHAMSLKAALKVLFVLLVVVPLSAFSTTTLLLVPYKTWGPPVGRWSQQHPIASNVASTVLFVGAMFFAAFRKQDCKCKYEETDKETT